MQLRLRDRLRASVSRAMASAGVMLQLAGDLADRLRARRLVVRVVQQRQRRAPGRCACAACERRACCGVQRRDVDDVGHRHAGDVADRLGLRRGVGRVGAERRGGGRVDLRRRRELGRRTSRQSPATFGTIVGSAATALTVAFCAGVSFGSCRRRPWTARPSRRASSRC